MPIPDDILISAMADAAEGKGVLVVTPLASETDAIVVRAKELTIHSLMRNAQMTRRSAEEYIVRSQVPWQIRLKSRGWVFFFPIHDLKPNDDVGNPSYVYSTGKKGTYEKLTYSSWKSTQIPPPTESVFDQDEEAKSAWSRLMEDDD